jgi:hypothetical protein
VNVCLWVGESLACCSQRLHLLRLLLPVSPADQSCCCIPDLRPVLQAKGVTAAFAANRALGAVATVGENEICRSVMVKTKYK